MDSRIAKRIDELSRHNTVSDLVEEIFPSRLDEVFASQAEKRRLTGQWITCYVIGKLERAQFQYKTPLELAEAIWVSSPEDDDPLFVALKKFLVEWIESRRARHIESMSNQ